ncbi:MAG: VOC family protein [Chloroflexota bacterium]|nr:VOC family protein [Chloroflexota bacterium]
MGVATAMNIIRIHHLTLAVRDAEAARATFESLFGVAGLGIASIPAFGVRTAGVPIGEDLLQLASPMSMDNPVMRFLERKGEGFYNVALEVDDLDAAVRELSAKGIRVSEPVEAEQGLRSTFVTMAATHGLSVQLVEVIGGDAFERSQPEPPPEPPQPATTAPAPEPEATASEPLDLTPDEWSDVE